MKKILLVAMSLFFAVSNMQAQDKSKDEEVKTVLVKEENSDNYYYEGVVPVEGVSKEEMYKRAKEWVLSNFKTEDNNAQFDEKELSIFNSPTISVGKFKNYSNDYLNFKIKLLFKNGKYKFRFDNLIVKSGVYPMYPPRPYIGKKIFPGAGIGGGKYPENLIDNINKSLLEMSIALENAIKGNAAKKDNW